MIGMTEWWDRLAAFAAVMLMAAAGALEALAHEIVAVAQVSVAAERGDAVQISEPPEPEGTPYVVPVADDRRAGWHGTHSTYPATDIFVRSGATLVSPVRGTVLEVRRVDEWDPAVDNPATRGGRSVSILGGDGVRYYLAHFATIVAGLDPGDDVTAGQVLGTMGSSGRSSACHLHFSISPPCAGKEWSVRRGVIWPYPYLDAWRDGEQRSPAPEVESWSAEHPDACAAAMADQYAADA